MCAVAQVLGSTLAGASGSTISSCSYCAQYVGGNGNMVTGYYNPNTLAASWEACAPSARSPDYVPLRQPRLSCTATWHVEPTQRGVARSGSIM